MAKRNLVEGKLLSQIGVECASSVEVRKRLSKSFHLPKNAKIAMVAKDGILFWRFSYSGEIYDEDIFVPVFHYDMDLEVDLSENSSPLPIERIFSLDDQTFYFIKKHYSQLYLYKIEAVLNEADVKFYIERIHGVHVTEVTPVELNGYYFWFVEAECGMRPKKYIVPFFAEDISQVRGLKNISQRKKIRKKTKITLHGYDLVCCIKGDLKINFRLISE